MHEFHSLMFSFSKEKKDICVYIRKRKRRFIFSSPIPVAWYTLVSHLIEQMDNKAKRREKKRKVLNTYPFMWANASVQQVHRPSLFSPSFFFLLFFFTTTFDDWLTLESSRQTYTHRIYISFCFEYFLDNGSIKKTKSRSYKWTYNLSSLFRLFNRCLDNQWMFTFVLSSMYIFIF